MRNRLLLFISVIFLFFVILASFLGQHSTVQAAATHIVISEIQVGVTGHANDEFVELYNPTTDVVDVTGWKLRRETQAGATTSANLVTSMVGSIPAHGFFLITSNQSAASGSADITYSTNHLTANNTVLLFDKTAVLIDKVGMGTASDFETVATVDPGNGKSIERKANSASTSLSMDIGGTDEFAGNGEDTDNNANDFVLRDVSQPQNSSSEIEPVVATSPSITPSTIPTVSLQPTESQTPSPTVTPTLAPTNSPTPTMTLTPSPTITPTPTITMTPTQSPTNSPTPTMTMAPTVTPTVTVTPTITPTLGITATLTPTESVHHHPFPRLVCSWTSQEIRFFGMVIRIPFLHCVWQ